MDKPISEETLRLLPGGWNSVQTIISRFRLSGAGDELLFEPLILKVLAHFTKLMEVYQPGEEEDYYV